MNGIHFIPHTSICQMECTYSTWIPYGIRGDSKVLSFSTWPFYISFHFPACHFIFHFIALLAGHFIFHFIACQGHFIYIHCISYFISFFCTLYFIFHFILLPTTFHIPFHFLSTAFHISFYSFAHCISYFHFISYPLHFIFHFIFHFTSVTPSYPL